MVPRVRIFCCIACAASDTGSWWWPNGVYYYPPWTTQADGIESLKEVFARLEYEQCDDSESEAGYQKVALYQANGVMQHTSVPMQNGRWRSKMGRGPVIEHRSPESLSRGIYGNLRVFMRKATSTIACLLSRGR